MLLTMSSIRINSNFKKILQIIRMIPLTVFMEALLYLSPGSNAIDIGSTILRRASHSRTFHTAAINVVAMHNLILEGW